MSNPLIAINPQASATVSASAGTGKTWLLVSRIIRLLLDGAKADAILAITFTRKAAAEMQSRLASRLFEFAAADDSQLTTLLQQIQAPTDPVTLSNARQLYERILHSQQKVRASTFHSFCQDILRRFPLDAGIAPGFELVDDTALLSKEAWDALVGEATLNPQSALANHLEALMDYCNSVNNTQEALFNFLEHRSDWWAFTEGQAQPVDYARHKLERDLQIAPDDDPLTALNDVKFRAAVAEFVTLLAKHPTATNLAHVKATESALDLLDTAPLDEVFTTLCPVFLTQDSNPRARKPSATQAKKMGDAGQDRFLQLHEELCAALIDIANRRFRLNLFKLCSVWYETGQQLLDRFQRLKTEQRLLDFSDLEWKTYNLLNHQDNAHWVQYKLDQRIDHLLIDEFQDTNPTQWRLIVPLLEELAAGQSERQRSVFLVGDRKQSIYGFRRAAPELFDAAQVWLQQSLDAVNQPLSTSWRSAPAIMQCVNWVFGDGPLNAQIQPFDSHDTHHKSLWGRVEVLPLAKDRAHSVTPTEEPTPIRNPLTTPRSETEDTRHYQEGRLIAAKIQSLVSQPTLIGGDGDTRKLAYKDIMILLRHRTHANAYEKALREAHIPYVGADRGTLLDTLEIKDMIALLETLVTPYNNLALAVVLRSPIFSCSNEQLMLLAELQQGTWLQRLQAVTQQPSPPPELLRSQTLLSDWNSFAGILPVHDLLDRIYNQGNILNRYEAAYPAHLKQRVRANLTRFIELALEVDSGRYPSIGNFLTRLKSLREQGQNGPDEVAASDSHSRVRIMTIHASKGMEAPVVFLADATSVDSSSKAYHTIVDWPAEQPRPLSYLLAPPKKQQDDIVQQWLARSRESELKEESNLLYVALTRAKQLLFISGCEPNRGSNLGWYGQIRSQLRAHMELDEFGNEEPIVFQNGEPPRAETRSEAMRDSSDINVSAEDLALKGPFPRAGRLKEIAPSYEMPTTWGTPNGVLAKTSDTIPNETTSALPHAAPNALDEDKQTRGNAIHRILHLLCEHFNEADIVEKIRIEFGLDLRTNPCDQWLAEARQVIDNPAWGFLYDAGQYQVAYNEAPIMYRQNNDTVYGFIDRLVVTDKQVILVDYKTHTVRDPNEVDIIADRYTAQLRLYKQGLAKCWPNLPLACYLLFTHSAQLKLVFV